MPELPEAEANRARVEDHALNRTIEGFWEGDTEHMDLPSEADRAPFLGTQFTQARRHGKVIFLGSVSGPWLVVHLGMTGSLRPFDAGDAPDYARFGIRFQGDRRLAFRCPRKFGSIAVVDSDAAWIEDQGLGPDALEIGRETFARVVGGTRGAVKSALMAQKKLAGLGNLWSDETLFRAGIRPDATAADLDADRVDGLHEAMRAVLQGVLDTGARYDRLPDDWLIHRRTDGADCPRCGGAIAKAKVGGRSAYFCTRHQSE